MEKHDRWREKFKKLCNLSLNFFSNRLDLFSESFLRSFYFCLMLNAEKRTWGKWAKRQMPELRGSASCPSAFAFWARFCRYGIWSASSWRRSWYRFLPHSGTLYLLIHTNSGWEKEKKEKKKGRFLILYIENVPYVHKVESDMVLWEFRKKEKDFCILIILYWDLNFSLIALEQDR